MNAVFMLNVYISLVLGKIHNYKNTILRKLKMSTLVETIFDFKRD